MKLNSSLAARKRGISDETRAKMIESRKKSGWKHSEESKLKISEKMKIIANARTDKSNGRHGKRLP